MQLKYYQINWFEPTDNKWNLLLDFIKANTNIIEFSEPLIPEFQKDKINIHKFAENELNKFVEITIFEQKIKPKYKYISYYDQQKDFFRPKLFYRFSSTNELVDKLFCFKSTNEFLENDFSLPAFYKETIPIVWFAYIFIVVGLDDNQKEIFCKNGFELKLLENQNYPTNPIENFNETIGISKAVKNVIDFGCEQRHFESFQDFNKFILPSGDQKTRVIGEFYSILFLRNLYSEPEYNVDFLENRVDDIYDIKISKSGKDYKKIQVKTVSIYSKTRLTTKINNPDKFDELIVISLDMNLYPNGLWIINSTKIKKTIKLIVPGLYFDFDNQIAKTFKGSEIFKNSPNKIDEFNKFMNDKYMIN
jgi:hypothetical protein